MRIGVLALQGDFAEHRHALLHLGADVTEVRLPIHLEGLDGLIMPGGESTTIGKLATTFGLLTPLRQFGRKRAIWGTCAGAIFLAKDVGRDQPLLGLMDITIERNGFGRQVDSFETDLGVPSLEEPERAFRGIFIRAPLIASVGKSVEVLARLPQTLEKGGGWVVAARQGHLLATSFHPELAGDDRFHRYFLKMAQRD